MFLLRIKLKLAKIQHWISVVYSYKIGMSSVSMTA